MRTNDLEFVIIHNCQCLPKVFDLSYYNYYLTIVNTLMLSMSFWIVNFHWGAKAHYNDSFEFFSIYYYNICKIYIFTKCGAFNFDVWALQLWFSQDYW
jgi:hypothetical protein